MPEFHETERKLRVVYMERGADRYGAFKRVVQETLEQIATLDFVNFIVKPPTRHNRMHFSGLPDSAIVADDVNSVILCKWADVVVGAVTSVLLEVLWQQKVLLYPKYFHDDVMWFEEMGACWTVNSPDELELALRQIKTNPSYRPYPQSAVDAFLKEAVYGGELNNDVLGRYSHFITSVASNGASTSPEINLAKTVTAKGRPT